MSELETLQQQRDTLETQRVAISEQLYTIECRILAIQAQDTYARTGLRAGDLLLMNEAARDVIYRNNPSNYTLGLWPIGEAVKLASVGDTSASIHHCVRPVHVGQIPLAIIQDMRRAYLESAGDA